MDLPCKHLFSTQLKYIQQRFEQVQEVNQAWLTACIGLIHTRDQEEWHKHVNYLVSDKMCNFNHLLFFCINYYIYILDLI